MRSFLTWKPGGTSQHLSPKRGHGHFASPLASGCCGTITIDIPAAVGCLMKHGLWFNEKWIGNNHVSLLGWYLFWGTSASAIVSFPFMISKTTWTLLPLHFHPRPLHLPLPRLYARSLACMMSLHWEQHITIIHGKSTPQSQTDRSKDVDDRWGEWWLGW